MPIKVGQYDLVTLIEEYKKSGAPETALLLQKLLPRLKPAEKAELRNYLGVVNSQPEGQAGQLVMSVYLIRLGDKVAVIDQSSSEIYLVDKGAEKFKDVDDFAPMTITGVNLRQNDQTKTIDLA